MQAQEGIAIVAKDVAMAREWQTTIKGLRAAREKEKSRLLKALSDELGQQRSAVFCAKAAADALLRQQATELETLEKTGQ